MRPPRPIAQPVDWRALIGGLGHQVHTARGLLGWSQLDLAHRAETSQGLVSRLERGDQLNVPLLSVLKVFHAFEEALPQLEGAATTTIRALVGATVELVAPAAPIDPGLAALLRAYHALSVGQRATFRRLVLPLAAVVAELPRTPLQPEPPGGSDDDARDARDARDA